MEQQKITPNIDTPTTTEFNYDTESSKSTPYYTPLEYMQGDGTTFDFPSPRLEQHMDCMPTTTNNDEYAIMTTTLPAIEATTTIVTPSPTIKVTNKQSKITSNLSPAVSRKLRRFSLYERRSCSPQHLLIKTNSIAGECQNKENTQPIKSANNITTTTTTPSLITNMNNELLLQQQQQQQQLQHLDEIDTITTATIIPEIAANNAISPKILSGHRLSYSPKLLCSINNLNLGSGNSPLSVISSAGYKTGNYFKFPEIDQHLQQQDTTTTTTATPTTSIDTIDTKIPITTTIDISLTTTTTATIISTATKTTTTTTDINLDKNNRKLKNKHNLTIKITDLPVMTNLDGNLTTINNNIDYNNKPRTPTIKSSKEKSLSLDTDLKYTLNTVNRSTSMSQLCNFMDKQNNYNYSYSLQRGNNRRQRCKLNDISTTTPPPTTTTTTTTTIEPLSLQQITTTATNSTNIDTTNTNNLKTLPEFLTLIEFNNAKDNIMLNYKQKSMDLPQTTASAANSSTNLLQRRGSNHSLTLNLHGSCSNLVSSNCRLSNLSAVGNSRSSGSLVIKPNHNYNHTTNKFGLKQQILRRCDSNQSHILTTAGVTPKRGLLERRGSNQSLTINMNNNNNNNNNSGNINNNCGQNATTTTTYTRMFYSSESLHKAADALLTNTTQTTSSTSNNKLAQSSIGVSGVGVGVGGIGVGVGSIGVCSCAGLRHIPTRPLSPQTTSEEFKMYLANIQLLQSASNALNQLDLLKLTYTFDNSYHSNNQSHLTHQPTSLMHVSTTINTTGTTTTTTTTTALSSPSNNIILGSTSEDNELDLRYNQVVANTLKSLHLGEEEQKRIFRDLHKEFWDLPLNHQEKPMVFGSQTKNRYRTILPNENSRFLLDKESILLRELNPTNDNNTLQDNIMEDEMPYINANYIKVSNTFYSLIFRQNSSIKN